VLVHVFLKEHERSAGSSRRGRLKKRGEKKVTIITIVTILT
jgi:hypothetical protein